MTGQLAATRHRTRVDGADVAWWAWGAVGDPTVLLVHGGAANAQWWGKLAQRVACDHRVIAVDLSGHGDSAWRPEYWFGQWAREVLAVADGPATLVGHSMGGIVAAVAAAAEPAAVRHLVLVDTPVERPTMDQTGDADATFAQPKSYPSREAAVARFRVLPPQPVSDHEFLQAVAGSSVRPADGRWVWKFDPRAFAGDGPVDRPADLAPILARATHPVTAIVGECSAVTPADARRVLRRLATYVEIPGGHHHLMFDAPAELERALVRALQRGEGQRGEGRRRQEQQP
jgi:pimeloyl-ACP methyl ester carboxylesterase